MDDNFNSIGLKLLQQFPIESCLLIKAGNIYTEVTRKKIKRNTSDTS